MVEITDRVPDVAEPFCFNCGYSLRGLDLPHVCPECGQMANPENQAAEARKWFASWRAWFWWRRPCRVPAGVAYLLDDPMSRRVARRRALGGLWLPAILCCLVIVAGAVINHQRFLHANDEDGGGIRGVVTFLARNGIGQHALQLAGLVIAWVLLTYSLCGAISQIATARKQLTPQSRRSLCASVRSAQSLVASAGATLLWTYLFVVFVKLSGLSDVQVDSSAST